MFKDNFPTLGSAHRSGLVWATLSLIVTLLPGLLLKLMAAGDKNAVPTQTGLAYSPAFNTFTLIIGFALAVYAMAKSRDDVSARTVAIIAIIAFVIKVIAFQ